LKELGEGINKEAANRRIKATVSHSNSPISVFLSFIGKAFIVIIKVGKDAGNERDQYIEG